MLGLIARLGHDWFQMGLQMTVTMYCGLGPHQENGQRSGYWDCTGMAGVTTRTRETGGDKIFHSTTALDSRTTMEWQAASEGRQG